MGWVYAIVALVAIGAGSAVVLTYNGAIKRAETAEAAAEGWKASQEYWQDEAEKRRKDFNAANRIAKQRGALVDEQRTELAARDNEIEVLRAASKDAAAWLAGTVPADVRRLRRKTAGCSTDLVVPCPAQPAGADPGAADGRRNERAPREGESRPP